MSTAQITDHSPPRAQQSVLIIFIGLMLAMFLSSLDQTIISTALPTIVGDLGGVAHLSWVITAYTLAITIAMPIYGKLGDQFGRRNLFLIAISVFILGSITSALSQSMDQLILFRALQGLGGGGLIVGAQAILGEVMSPRDRAKYGGFMGATFGLSSVLGPLLGGFLTQHVSWHWTFWVNVPIGLAALIMTAKTLHLPKRNARHTVDYLGMATMAPAVSSLILVSTWGGGQYAWTSPVILSLVAAFAVLTALFIWIETRAAEPLIPLSLFKNRSFALATSVGLLVGAGMFAAASYLPTFLQIVRQVGITTSGLLMVPMVGGILVTSIISGRVVSKTGRYRAFPVAGMVLATVGVALMSTMNASTSAWTSSAYMVILGAGLGMVMQILVLVVQNAVSPSLIGTATASNNFFREIGITLGVSGFGAIFSHRLADRLGNLVTSGSSTVTPQMISRLPAGLHDQVVTAYVSALTPAFIFLVPVLALGVVLALFIPHVELSTSSASARVEEDRAAVESPGQAEQSLVAA